MKTTYPEYIIMTEYISNWQSLRSWNMRFLLFYAQEVHRDWIVAVNSKKELLADLWIWVVFMILFLEDSLNKTLSSVICISVWKYQQSFFPVLKCENTKLLTWANSNLLYVIDKY